VLLTPRRGVPQSGTALRAVIAVSGIVVEAYRASHATEWRATIRRIVRLVATEVFPQKPHPVDPGCSL
jgi:hypothetical protein